MFLFINTKENKEIWIKKKILVLRGKSANTIKTYKYGILHFLNTKAISSSSYKYSTNFSTILYTIVCGLHCEGLQLLLFFSKTSLLLIAVTIPLLFDNF